MMNTEEIKQFGRVAVLAGGNSRERDISLQSGNAVMEALSAFSIEAELIDTQVLNIEKLKQFDRAFIALHGVGGEDGQIQALLESLNIPYTGSGVAASAIAMDKVRSKHLFCAADIPTPDYAVARSLAEASVAAEQIEQ